MHKPEHRAAAHDDHDGADAGEWQPVATAPFVGVIVFALAALWFGNRGERWFPLLDGANLLFHEFGHPFFGLVSARLAVYGGTLAQFLFPLAAAFKFRQTRATCSFALCMLWLFQNLFGIARYMADARAKLLPLVGGKDPEDAHDWAEILSRWGWLQADTRLAATVTALGWLGILLCCAWLGRRWASDRAES
jgi:hypothetical protein